MEFRRTEKEVLGEPPHREIYEVYEGSGKLMELSFLESSDLFEIYVQNIKGGKKVEGETTALFKLMLEKMKAKANELGRPVRLVLDPVVPIVKVWARTKAADVIGGWDSISADEGRFEKIIYPDKK